MRHNEFAYWLQGFFEIREAHPDYDKEKVEPLTDDQIEVIYNHLQLCKKVEGSLNEFGAWLSGVISVYHCVPDNETSFVTLSIKTQLNNLFQHVIDPQYEGDKDELQAIHDGDEKKKVPPIDASVVRGLLQDLREGKTFC